MRTLEDLRRDIDRVDEVLVRLLNERARCACEIGRLKKDLGVEVYQPEREKQVLEHVRSVAAEGPLGPDAIVRLFERIIDEARRLERRMVHEDVSADEKLV
jgi:chorismate mutase